MANGKHTPLSLLLTLVLLGANLVALNYLIAGWSGARLDLTKEGVFSISDATRRILTSLDEEVTINGYFSKRTHPKLAPLVPEIVDLLEEYRAVSRGKVHVELIDPGEDDEVEQEAAERFGVRSTPFRLASKYESGIVNAFFALVVRYGDRYERYGFEDLIDVEPLPDGDIDVRLRNLEYDLTRAVKKVVFGFRSTAELFERIDQPVRLTAVMTPDTLPDVLVEIPQAMRDAATGLGEKGGEAFIYEEIDPSKDEAARRSVESRFGLRPMSLSFFSDESFYLYGILEVGGRLEQLVLTGDGVTSAAIRESVENALRRNTPGFLKTVGIVAPEEPQIPPEMRMQYQLPPQPPPEFEEIKRFLAQDYQVQNVTLDESAGVPSVVDVLLVLKPKNLTEEQVYRLDQYLMRGGRVVICGGNYEADFNPQGLNVRSLSSGLDPWLAHYGVTVSPTMVLDDRNQALPIPEIRSTPLGNLRTWTMAPYPYLVQVRDEGFANRDVAATLDGVGIYWGSPLDVDEEKAAGLEVLPLLRSSELSWTSDDTSRVGYVDYTVPAEGTEPHLLGVALSGRFGSYFAGKDAPLPASSTSPDALDDDDTEPESIPSNYVTLDQSPQTRLVVIGNAEFLSDFVARSLGRMDGGFFGENLRFVQNLLDWVSLDNDMIEIRSRGVTSRRLQATERATEFGIEIASYLIPVAALIALAVFLYWRRRNTAPLLGAARASVITGRRGEEAS